MSLGVLVSLAAVFAAQPEPIAVYVEDAPGVVEADVRQIAEALGESLKRRTHIEPVIQIGIGAECPLLDRCMNEVRDRTRAQEIVYVTLVGGPTKIRALCERIHVQKGSIQSTQADLDRDPASWRQALDAIAQSLFTEPLPPAAADVQTTPPADPAMPGLPRLETEPKAPNLVATTKDEPKSETDLVPYIVAGASVAVLVTGIVFGLNSKSARDRAETEVIDSPIERQELSDQVVTQAWTANVLYGVSAVGLTTAGLLFFDVF